MEHDVTKKRTIRVNPVNLPNALTVLRIILVPIFLYLLTIQGITARWWAVVLFVIASLSDYLDGQIARRWNIVTDFGKVADPIADKALTLGAFAMLSLTQPEIMPWWATVLIAVRELGVTWWRGVLLKQGIVVPANWGGKIKTTLQLFFIFLVILPWQVTSPSEQTMTLIAYLTVAMFWATVVMTVASGIEYIYSGWKQGKAAAGGCS